MSLSLPTDRLPPGPAASRLAKALGRLQIDRAICYGAAMKIWLLGTGPVIVYLITKKMSPEIQGIHYTFASITALGAFFELGLGTMLTQFVSHEWSGLRFTNGNRIEGEGPNLDRLAGLTRFSAYWYGILSIVFFAAASAIGYAIIHRKTGPEIAWLVPFVALMAISAINMLLIPAFSILEGCGCVASVAKCRTIAAVGAVLAVILCLCGRMNLWVLFANALSTLLTSTIYIGILYRHTFKQLLRRQSAATVNWAHEIFPLQSQYAVNAVAGYFLFSVYTPIVFSICGPVQAGKVGLTMQLVAQIQSIATLWIVTKAPFYGALIAKRDYAGLDALFRKGSVVAMGANLIGQSLLVLGTLVGGSVLPTVASRLAGVPVVLLFSVASLSNVFSYCLGYYLIGFKKNPMMKMVVVAAVVNLGLVLALTRYFGVLGAALAQAIVFVGIITPWHLSIWRRFRRKWVLPHYALAHGPI